MTWEHIAVLSVAAAVSAAVLLAGGWLQMRRILGEFDAAYPEPEPEPVVSTLPEPDPPGWSSEIGWDAAAEYLRCIELAADPDAYAAAMDARRAAGERAWAARILRDADAAPILAELMAAGLAAIEPAPKRELTGATK